MTRSLSRAALALLLLGACRGQPIAQAQRLDLPRLVDSLRPPVEKATGLAFTETPRSAMIPRSAVAAYLQRQFDRELPTARREGIEAAYRLLGFLPDSVNLGKILLALYTEQVAGYYDPETRTLYGVEGADPSQLRLVLAHELVHALQGQHLPLDALMHDTTSDGDMRTARQAIFEGQATIASIQVLAPQLDILGDDGFWETYREQIEEGQAKLPAFRDAPEVLKTGLIFPYLQGAEFMRWWERGHDRTVQPYGDAMPQSSEQILHPERLAKGDAPVRLRFAATTEKPVLEDVIGEAELRLLSDLLTGSKLRSSPIPLGWGGDRYRVLRTPAGPAVDWAVVFDEPRLALRFRPVLEALVARARPGYRLELANLQVADRSGFRVTVAPTAWTGWRALPAVSRLP